MPIRGSPIGHCLSGAYFPALMLETIEAFRIALVGTSRPERLSRFSLRRNRSVRRYHSSTIVNRAVNERGPKWVLAGAFGDLEGQC